MKITIARTAGFCMGVKRAVDMALQAAIDYPPPIYTLGPLIHNRQVTAFLEERGIYETEQIPENGVVIIRAHGVAPDIISEINKRKLILIDATCPHVSASQKIIRRAAGNGQQIIIAGDKEHPEVIGLAGQAPAQTTIVSTTDEASGLNIDGAEFTLIAQTTFKASLYQEIAHILSERLPKCRVCDSICAATEERQLEAREIAREYEAVIVIGGRHSANTCRLAEIAREENDHVYHIEQAGELEPQKLKDFSTIAITAGASTPQWLIDETGNLLAEL